MVVLQRGKTCGCAFRRRERLSALAAPVSTAFPGPRSVESVVNNASGTDCSIRRTCGIETSAIRHFCSALTMRELCLQNSGSNSSTRTGYAAATNTSWRKHPSFGNIIASGDDLPEGGTGATSWQVSPNLGIGQTYYWRARASVGGTQGPFSPAANFEVQGGFASSTPVGSVFVSDPLTNGVSVGEVGGGEFQTEGWMATDALSYIRYDIPTTPNGFVEFQVSNLMDLNPHSAKRNLLIMWDPKKRPTTAGLKRAINARKTFCGAQPAS